MNNKNEIEEFKNAPDLVDELTIKRHSKDAKQIQFGDQFDERPKSDQIKYLKKLTSSLNHAVILIQKERNELNTICFLKEAQLVKCQKQLASNQAMIQKQLMAHNQVKESLLSENQNLYAEIKKLNGRVNVISSN